jgi:hypothetical protein
VDGLMQLFGTFLRVYARDVPLARLFVQELLFRSDRSEPLLALSTELHARAVRIVEDGRARGELRSDLGVDALVRALVAHYVYWIQLWLGTGVVTRRAAERGLREALELQLEGIARRES